MANIRNTQDIQKLLCMFKGMTTINELISLEQRLCALTWLHAGKPIEQTKPIHDLLSDVRKKQIELITL